MNESLMLEGDAVQNSTSLLSSSPCTVGNFASEENVTDIFWDYHQQGRTSIVIASTVVQLLLFLTGVPLNMYIIARVWWKRLYTQATYVLFMNLAICDLLLCVFPIGLNCIAVFLGHYGFGDSDYERCQSCKLTVAYFVLNILSSLNIALISLDRLAFFIIPLKYSKVITAKKAALALAVIWCISCLFITGPLLGYGDAGFSIMCGPVFATSEHIKKSIPHLLAAATVYGLAIVILIVSNIWIACIAHKQLQNTYNMAAMLHLNLTQEEREEVKRSRRESTRKQLKLFKVFGGILIVNIITYLPVTWLLVASVAMTEAPNGKEIIFLCIFTKVAFHPLVEAFFTPELPPTLPNWCAPLRNYTTRIMRDAASHININTDNVLEQNQNENTSKSNVNNTLDDSMPAKPRSDTIELHALQNAITEPSPDRPTLEEANSGESYLEDSTPDLSTFDVSALAEVEPVHELDTKEVEHSS